MASNPLFYVGTEAQRAASAVVPAARALVVTDEGNLYVGDGSAAASALSKLAHISEIPAAVSAAVAADPSVTSAAVARVTALTTTDLNLARYVTDYSEAPETNVWEVIDGAGNVLPLSLGADGLPSDEMVAALASKGLVALSTATDYPGPLGIVTSDGSVLVGSDSIGRVELPEPAPSTRRNFFAVTQPTMKALSAGNRTKLYQVANNATKYALNTYLPSWINSASYPYPIPLPSSPDTAAQPTIRPPAMSAQGVAALIASGQYNATTIGVSQATATATAANVLASIALTHTANGGWWGGIPAPWDETTPDVGNQDSEAAMWAGQVATGAFLIWSSLSGPQQAAVTAMIVQEANRFLRYKVKYWRDRQNNEIYGFDTKGEELAWNVSVLGAALMIVPNHANADQWTQRMIEMSLAATAQPASLTDATVLHGSPLSEVLNGYNVRGDGMAENHNVVNPGYTMSIMMELLSVAGHLAVAGLKVPLAMCWNVDPMYASCTDLNLGFLNAASGGTFYRSDGTLNYPNGSDWGTDRRMDTACTDITVATFGCDRQSTTKADYWAGIHLSDVITQQARGSTGQTYQSGDSETYDYREELICSYMYASIICDLAGQLTTNTLTIPRITNATAPVITSQNRGL